MKNHCSINPCGILLGVAALVLSLAILSGQTTFADNAGAAGEWVSLFNGKDLTGWDGDRGLWSVKDGVLHGETTKEKPHKSNTFLVYRGGSFDDFELKVKFRLLGGNSGVQYRSKEFDKWRIAGYQADILEDPRSGRFPLSGGRPGLLGQPGEFVVVRPRRQPEGHRQRQRQAGADRRRLLQGQGLERVPHHLPGNHIVQYLNGYKTIELIDNDRLVNPADPKDRRGSRTGLLALQLHAGPPMAVEFKDIRIQRITPPCGDAVLAFNGRNLDEWTTNAGSGKANKWAVGKAKVSAGDPKQLEKVEGTGEMINLTPAHGAEPGHLFEGQVRRLPDRGGGHGAPGLELRHLRDGRVRDPGARQLRQGEDGQRRHGRDLRRLRPSGQCLEEAGRVAAVRDRVVEAPRFDAGGKKTKNAKFVKVELNGQVLHKDLVMPGATPGGVTGKEVPQGP